MARGSADEAPGLGHALALPWRTGPGPTSRDPLWQRFADLLLPDLRDLHRDGALRTLLPYAHTTVTPPVVTAPDQATPAGDAGTDDRGETSRPPDDGSWSALVVLVCRDRSATDALAADLAGRASTGALGEVGRLVGGFRLEGQPGLDMLYPREAGRAGESRLIQWVEYVVSDPAQRARYYDDQYRFSGPAVRQVYDAGGIGRFVGFESRERFLGEPAGADVPDWDVLHLSGLRPTQGLLFSRRLSRAFDVYAPAVRGAGARGRDVVASWAGLRTKTHIRARQLAALTLQAPPE